jgi:hypothetical protein
MNLILKNRKARLSEYTELKSLDIIFDRGVSSNGVKNRNKGYIFVTNPTAGKKTQNKG